MPFASHRVRALIALALLAAVGGFFAVARPSLADDGPPDMVWVDAANGHDDNDGTELSPFASIAKGLASVNDGGTVHVLPGEYAGDFTISKSVTLRGARAGIPGPDRDIAVTGGESVINGGAGSYVLGIADRDIDVTLEGLYFAPGPKDSLVVLVDSANAQLTFQDNLVRLEAVNYYGLSNTNRGPNTRITVRNNAFVAPGVEVTLASMVHLRAGKFVLEGNLFEGGRAAFEVNSPASLEVRRNHMRRVNGAGVRDAHDAVLADNVFENLHDRLALTCDHCTITRNSFIDSRDEALSLYGLESVISNNHFANGGLAIGVHGDDNLVTGNDISGFRYAVFVGPWSDAEVTRNLFGGNEFGLLVDDWDAEATGICNWWGSESGP